MDLTSAVSPIPSPCCVITPGEALFPPFSAFLAAGRGCLILIYSWTSSQRLLLVQSLREPEKILPEKQHLPTNPVSPWRWSKCSWTQQLDPAGPAFEQGFGAGTLSDGITLVW